MASTQLRLQPMAGPPINRPPDPFVRIPSELCGMILSLLPPEDLISASHVSSFLRSQCLDESLYIPLVKPGLNALLLSAKSFSGDIPSGDVSSYALTEIKKLVAKLGHVSATSYFDDINSIREYFLRRHFLMRSWSSGRAKEINLRMPKSYQNYKGPRVPIDSLVIDPVYKQVVSMDTMGTVVFWDLETGRMTKSFKLELANSPKLRGLMDLKGDILLISAWRAEIVHICIRDPPSTPKSRRGFSVATPLLIAYPIRSVVLEGAMCIIGYFHGDVEFWKLQKGEQSQCGQTIAIITPAIILAIPYQGSSYRNLGAPARASQTLHYKRPYLLLSDYGLVRFSPRNRDANNLLDLWNYSAEDIASEVFSDVVIHDVPPRLVSLSNTIVSLAHGGSDVLIALPGSYAPDAVIRIDDFWNTAGPAVVGTLLTTSSDETQLYSFVATDSFFLTQSQTWAGWHRQPSHKATVRLHHESGHPIVEYLGYSMSNDLAIDPCFFASVGGDRDPTIVIRDFRPKCGRDDKSREVNTPEPAKPRLHTPSPLKRRVNRKTSKESPKKVERTPKRESVETTNIPEATPASTTKPTSTSAEIAPNSGNTGIEQSQEAIPWGEAAVQALIGCRSDRGGLSVPDILGLVMCLGLREITLGEEEDILEEVEDALRNASQSSAIPIERVAASHGAEPKYRVSLRRTSMRGRVA
ncbi:MAG: hypothetical protein M1839_005167 [Geoglossum umbratile]|nr:MAG: hypothetical protein M1839_005167 [Geoglossum umbratile]